MSVRQAVNLYYSNLIISIFRAGKVFSSSASQIFMHTTYESYELHAYASVCMSPLPPSFISFFPYCENAVFMRNVSVKISCANVYVQTNSSRAIDL